MKTAEEILDKWIKWDYDLERVADKIFFINAMEEYASQYRESGKPEPVEQEDTCRVLLLASYCGDNPDCSENHPCPECLQMCNIFTVPESEIKIKSCIGQFDQTP